MRTKKHQPQQQHTGRGPQHGMRTSRIFSVALKHATRKFGGHTLSTRIYFVVLHWHCLQLWIFPYLSHPIISYSYIQMCLFSVTQNKNLHHSNYCTVSVNTTLTTASSNPSTHYLMPERIGFGCRHFQMKNTVGLPIPLLSSPVTHSHTNKHKRPLRRAV